MMQDAVVDKNWKCSVDQTVSFNRSFGSADEGVSFVSFCGLWYSKDEASELGLNYSVTANICQCCDIICTMV